MVKKKKVLMVFGILQLAFGPKTLASASVDKPLEKAHCCGR